MKNSADLGGCYPDSVDNTLLDLQNSSYRKIPKAFFEGLIFGGGGGAYLRSEICVSKLIGLAL